MSGTTSRRCRTCSRRSSARCARPSSPTTSCPTGGLTFRQKLPLGSGFDVIGPCADGHFGAIIKTYRDWKLSGDTDWLQPLWPNVRRAIEYAWSPDNPDRWDPDADRHPLRPPAPDPRHGAVRAELLARLDVCRRAARRLRDGRGAGRDATSPTRCARAWPQTAPPTSTTSSSTAAGSSRRSTSPTRACWRPSTPAARPACSPTASWRPTGPTSIGELKYQMGEGCITDQILGQWHAEVAGLGGFLDDGKVTAALKAVHANNFRPASRTTSTRAATTPIEDEGGLLVATYPEGVRQPMVAAPYAEEVWTGIEYMSASHMIMRGLVDEGLDIVRAARDRHDGARRNPWNDIECGSYYARSMSAWQLVNAWSGLSADLVAGPHRLRAKGRGRLRAVLVGRQRLRQLLARSRRQLTPRACSAAASTSPRSPSPASARTGSQRRAIAPGERLTLQFAPETDGSVMAAIELRDVRKSFQALEVIHGIDLAVDDGSFTVFVGPSGCGKSTLLRMIAGLEEVSSGEIHIDGERCDHLLPSARGMAMVFQSYALYPHMSVEQNLRFGLENQRTAQARDRQAGRQGRRDPADRASAEAPPEPALRRPEPARRHRPRHRQGAQGVPVRRAAVQPRRRAAGQDARRAGRAAPPAEVDDDLRHPRPGRGHDHGRPDRGAERRRGRAGRLAGRALRAARATASSPASSARRR